MSIQFRPHSLAGPVSLVPKSNRQQSVTTMLSPSLQDVVHFGAQETPPPKPEKPAPKKGALLAKMIEFAKKMDGKEVHKPNSITNRIYQETFDRNLGVIVYGSSRTAEGSPEYLYAVEVGKAIGSQLKGGKQMYVVTGGGPGAMRALGEGATSVGAHAVGSAMNFIGETPSNDVHPEFVVHPNFAERIDAKGGYEHRGAYTAVVPGGPGTEQEIWKKANELFYDQTLYPCQKQIVLFDFDNYYSSPRGFIDHVKYLIEKGKANPRMIDMFKVVQSPTEGAKLLLDESIPWTPGQLPKETEKAE